MPATNAAQEEKVTDAKETPKCTVIVPVFNSERWVESTLRSIQNQSYRAWECLVINDGSTDNSRLLVEEFVRDDSRFKLINTNNQGVAKARNLGILNALGDFLAFLDADDIWLPNKLELQVKSLTDDIIADYTLANYIIFKDSTLKIVARVHLKKLNTLIRHWFNFTGDGPAAASTLMIKRASITRVGGYNIELHSTADLDLMLKLQNKFKYVPTKKILVGYRIHDKQMHSDLQKISKEFQILSLQYISNKTKERKYRQRVRNYFYLAAAVQESQRNVFGYIKVIVANPGCFFLFLQLLKKTFFRKILLLNKTSTKLIASILKSLHKDQS